MDSQYAIQELRENLSKAKQVIEQQNHVLQQITAVPRPVAVVLKHERYGATAFVSFENKSIEVGIDPKISERVQPGDSVSLSKDTMAIIGMSDFSLEGPLLIVEEVIDGRCKVEWVGSPKLISQGKYAGAIRRGDRVVDDTCSIIIKNLGKVENAYKIEKSHGVTWNDIGGLEDAKRDIIEALIDPIKKADLYAFYGRKACKGILLYGPPRCGKTLLVKAATTAIGEAFGDDAISSGFIYIKGPELLSKYVGVSEERIGQLFLRTKAHKDKHGYPAVLFIDEAEAILSKRGSGISSDINNTIVPAFLSHMDGIEETGAMVILATNRSDILDPAIVGPGRIDRKVYVGRPTQSSAAEIFKVHMKNIPIADSEDVSKIIDVGVKEMFCPEKKLYEIRLKGRMKSNKFFTFGHLCSGGMIAEIVQQASNHAMRRNELQKTSMEEWGVRRIDMISATKDAFRQNYNIDHSDDLSTFVSGFRKDVEGIEKVIIKS